MLRAIVLFTLILSRFTPLVPHCLAQSNQTGDWEFVPLTGGHIKCFVPNPFNENDLFALAEGAGIFYSSDRGHHWRSINGNKGSIVPVSVGDLAITQNRTLIATNNENLAPHINS